MSERIKPTAKQKSKLVLHFIIYAIACAIMFYVHHKQGEKEWAYPWHAWIIAAWSLSLLGHFCSVFFSYEDSGNQEYQRQLHN